MSWRNLSLALLGLCLLAGGRADAAAPPPEGPLDLALVLAIDTSASITRDAYLFQIDGHLAALRSREFAEAVASGRHGAVALTVALWNSPRTLSQAVPWTRLSTAAEIAAFADRLSAAREAAVDGNTAIGSAMLAAAELLQGIEADRKVIDISANGFNNAGLDPALARDALSKGDVTVNAVVITDEFNWLPQYFEENVITGLNAFVVDASDGQGFVRALRAKLVTEVSGRPLPRQFAAVPR